jgi:catechol 2,3-dioxygenase-like lactoylglutathione lyase family enzyme
MQSPDIAGFFHYGIAVRNLEDVTSFFVNALGLQVVASREIRADYINKLVNSEGTWAEVVLLDLGKTGYLELLRWHDKEYVADSLQRSITSVGAQHLCLFVYDIETIVESFYSYPIIEMVSQGITTVTEGPNKGAKVAFVQVDNILFLELFQRPKPTK